VKGKQFFYEKERKKEREKERKKENKREERIEENMQELTMYKLKLRERDREREKNFYYQKCSYRKFFDILPKLFRNLKRYFQ
jgi:hypothetical protein